MDIKRAGSQPSGKGPAEYFTGTVRIDPLFGPPDPARAVGALVTFEPGARSAWHTHPAGQRLVVVSGARDLTTPLQSAGFTLESEAATEDGRHVTVARFPSFTTARPLSPEADEASAAENRRLAHELERTRELLGRERATIAREMQLGKDELLAMDRQVAELQVRIAVLNGYTALGIPVTEAVG